MNSLEGCSLLTRRKTSEKKIKTLIVHNYSVPINNICQTFLVKNKTGTTAVKVEKANFSSKPSG